MWLYTYIYTYKYIYIHVYICIYIFTHMYVFIYRCGCAICQNYMFSGESNTPPFFRRLQQIWKTKSITVARPTGIPDSRRVAAYVCVNLACTSSIILQTRNTADAHPLIIRSPMWRMPLARSWLVCRRWHAKHNHTHMIEHRD